MGTPRLGGALEGGAELSAGAEKAQAAGERQDPAACDSRERRFYGRRKGRKLSLHQSSLLAGKLSSLSLDLSKPLGGASALAAAFSAPVSEVWLEIGFGGGEHLLWQAESHPHAGLIGAEPFINGVAAVLSGIERKGLEPRIRLHAHDATPLLDWLPPESIARAFMLFPDPWPKKRHRRRRLLSASLLDRLARILAEGAEFRFASDIADYAEQALALVAAHPVFTPAQVFSSANRGAVPDWPITRYEMKAEREGRSSTFLIAKRV